MLPTKFRFIWLSSFKGEFFLEIDQSETRIACGDWPPQAILVSDWLISKKSSPLKLHGQMNRNLVLNIYGKFSINIVRLVPMLTDRDEMSKLYRGPSIDASHQVSVHLAMRFQRRIFF
jgi:hypothetical protein